MNNYIFKHILLYINSYNNKENKNMILNEIEEYIEWCEYSIKRFNKDYNSHILFLRDIQSSILLDNYLECNEKIGDQLLFLSLSSNEEDLA